MGFWSRIARVPRAVKNSIKRRVLKPFKKRGYFLTEEEKRRLNPTHFDKINGRFRKYHPADVKAMKLKHRAEFLALRKKMIAAAAKGSKAKERQVMRALFNATRERSDAVNGGGGDFRADADADADGSRRLQNKSKWGVAKASLAFGLPDKKKRAGPALRWRDGPAFATPPHIASMDCEPMKHDPSDLVHGDGGDGWEPGATRRRPPTPTPGRSTPLRDDWGRAFSEVDSDSELEYETFETDLNDDEDMTSIPKTLRRRRINFDGTPVSYARAGASLRWENYDKEEEARSRAYVDFLKQRLDEYNEMMKWEYRERYGRARAWTPKPTPAWMKHEAPPPWALRAGRDATTRENVDGFDDETKHRVLSWWAAIDMRREAVIQELERVRVTDETWGEESAAEARRVGYGAIQRATGHAAGAPRSLPEYARASVLSSAASAGGAGQSITSKDLPRHLAAGALLEDKDAMMRRWVGRPPPKPPESVRAVRRAKKLEEKRLKAVRKAAWKQAHKELVALRKMQKKYAAMHPDR